MNGVGKNRSFLTEFIIVILFFSIASVIIVSVFVNANNISKDSERITYFSLMSKDIEAKLSNACYDYDNPLGDMENSPVKLLESIGYTEDENGVYIAYLNNEFEYTDKNNMRYIVKIKAVVDESFDYSKIVSYGLSFSNGDDTLEDKEYYEISFNKLILGKEN